MKFKGKKIIIKYGIFPAQCNEWLIAAGMEVWSKRKKIVMLLQSIIPKLVNEIVPRIKGVGPTNYTKLMVSLWKTNSALMKFPKKKKKKTKKTNFLPILKRK